MAVTMAAIHNHCAHVPAKSVRFLQVLWIQGARMKTLFRSGAPLALTLLAACGDGTEPSRGTLTAAPTEKSAAVVVNRATAQTLAAAPGPYGDASPAMAAEQLLDFAERSYPNYFPGREQTRSYQRFLYRYYPGSGRYVAVAVGVSQGDGLVEGGVYVLGQDFGSAPLYVGS